MVATPIKQRRRKYRINSNSEKKNKKINIKIYSKFIKTLKCIFNHLRYNFCQKRRANIQRRVRINLNKPSFKI